MWGKVGKKRETKRGDCRHRNHPSRFGKTFVAYYNFIRLRFANSHPDRQNHIPGWEKNRPSLPYRIAGYSL